MSGATRKHEFPNERWALATGEDMNHIGPMLRESLQPATAQSLGATACPDIGVAQQRPPWPHNPTSAARSLTQEPPASEQKAAPKRKAANVASGPRRACHMALCSRKPWVPTSTKPTTRAINLTQPSAFPREEKYTEADPTSLPQAMAEVKDNMAMAHLTTRMGGHTSRLSQSHESWLQHKLGEEPLVHNMPSEANTRAKCTQGKHGNPSELHRYEPESLAQATWQQVHKTYTHTTWL